jgi:hypothetical protein
MYWSHAILLPGTHSIFPAKKERVIVHAGKDLVPHEDTREK